ncbi:hypothetical protein D9M71_587090 [compost metagenome]
MREDEIHHQRQAEDFQGLERGLIQLPSAEAQVGQSDQRHQRSVFQQFDQQVGARRDGREQGLRQNDPAKTLVAAEVQRRGRFILTFGHGADRTAHHLGAIRADVQAEADDGDAVGAQCQIERWQRQHEKQPEQLHQQRRAAKHFNVGNREPTQRPPWRHAPQRRQNGRDNSQDRAEEGHLERDPGALYQKRK